MGGYIQDDWRVGNKLTVNYGIRLEHETRMMEKNDNQTVNVDQTAIDPLNGLVTLIDPEPLDRSAAAAVPRVRQRLHAAVGGRALTVQRRDLPDPPSA